MLAQQCAAGIALGGAAERMCKTEVSVWAGTMNLVALHTGQSWWLVELFSEIPLTYKMCYGFHRTCLSTCLHIHGLNTVQCCSSLLRNGSILL